MTTMEGVEPVKLDAKALEAALRETIKFLGWVTESYRTHAADPENHPEIRDAYEGSAQMAEDHAKSLTAYLSALSPVSPSPAIEHMVGSKPWSDVRYLMSVIDTAIEDGFDPDEDGPLLDEIRAELAASPIAPRTSEPVAAWTKGSLVLATNGVEGEFTKGKSYVLAQDATAHNVRVVADDSGEENGWVRDYFVPVTATAQPDTLRELTHAFNEMSDGLSNDIQRVRNIRDGIYKLEDIDRAVLPDMEAWLETCNGLARKVLASLKDSHHG